MTKHWQLQVLGLESCTQDGPRARSPVGTEAIGSLWGADGREGLWTGKELVVEKRRRKEHTDWIQVWLK